MDQGITFRGASPHFKHKPHKQIVEFLISKKLKSLRNLYEIKESVRRTFKYRVLGSPLYYEDKKILKEIKEKTDLIASSPRMKEIRSTIRNDGRYHRNGSVIFSRSI